VSSRIGVVTESSHAAAPGVATERVALLLPGGGYGPEAPLLWFARSVLERRGWSVRVVRWDEHGAETAADVDALVGRLLDQVPVDRAVVVAKSKGTYGLPAAVARGVPGVWLTPVLTDPAVAAALAVVTAPTLTVGGTGDSMWVPDLARAGRAEVLEVDGADHSLQTGSWPEDLAILQRVTERIDTFLTRLD
jgi:hypothetical protein